MTTNQKMTEPRIELWSNESDSEFAISLTPEKSSGSRSSSELSFVIKTNDKASYSKKIDESVCMDGYTYNWKHTLAQWVHFHYGNEVAASIPSSTIEYKPVEKIEPKQKKLYHMKYFKLGLIGLRKGTGNTSKSRSQSILKQGSLKCHYCNLKYCLEEERMQHEEFWHSEKNPKPSINITKV